MIHPEVDNHLLQEMNDAIAAHNKRHETWDESFRVPILDRVEVERQIGYIISSPTLIDGRVEEYSVFRATWDSTPTDSIRVAFAYANYASHNTPRNHEAYRGVTVELAELAKARGYSEHIELRRAGNLNIAIVYVYL